MKYVSIASNENPIYLYYIPLVKWAWAKFSWGTSVAYVGPQTKVSDFVNETIDGYDWRIINNAGKYSNATIAQVCRMYACQKDESDDLMMLSDCDMIALSNYWTPNEEEITCWGRNLSDEHQPVCYVSMKTKKWAEVMKYEEIGMWNDLELWHGLSTNKWVIDQNLLTDKIRPFKRTEIHRDIDKRTNYPIGRVDRSAWSLDHRQFIDCHAPHDVLTNDKSFHNLMQLLHTLWPNEDWKWFLTYTKEFKKIL